MNRNIIIGLLIIVGSSLVGVGTFTNALLSHKRYNEKVSSGFLATRICQGTSCYTKESQTYQQRLVRYANLAFASLLVLLGLILGLAGLPGIDIKPRFVQSIRKAIPILIALSVFFAYEYISLGLANVDIGSGAFGYVFYCLITGFVLVALGIFLPSKQIHKTK
jgi:hypothetical protein